MKKSLLTIVICTMLAMTASAKPVSPQAARQAAATFLHIDESTLHEVPLQWETLHLFAIDKGGFVLTSAACNLCWGIL